MRNMIPLVILNILCAAFTIEACNHADAPKLSQKPEQGAPSTPATELTQSQARDVVLSADPSFTVVHYSRIAHIIKVGKGTPQADGSYSIDYKTLENADQIAPDDGGNPTPPSCDCENGTRSWFCACDPKHKILIVGVPDCCEGYCGAYGVLIWCWNGCSSKVATCGDVFH